MKTSLFSANPKNYGTIFFQWLLLHHTIGSVHCLGGRHIGSSPGTRYPLAVYLSRRNGACGSYWWGSFFLVFLNEDKFIHFTPNQITNHSDDALAGQLLSPCEQPAAIANAGSAEPTNISFFGHDQLRPSSRLRSRWRLKTNIRFFGHDQLRHDLDAEIVAGRNLSPCEQPAAIADAGSAGPTNISFFGGTTRWDNRVELSHDLDAEIVAGQILNPSGQSTTHLLHTSTRIRVELSVIYCKSMQYLRR